MIVAKSPLRVSFVGGGSDFPDFFNNKKGAVLGTTINKYVYVCLSRLSPLSKERFRITYRKTESVNEIGEITHPVVRAALNHFEINESLNIATMADLPGGTGLGSSSSFTVALCAALTKFNGGKIDPDNLAKTAIHLERDILKETGGWQDQYHAAIGGFRLYSFKNNSVGYTNELLNNNDLKTLSSYFSMVHVGVERRSAEHARTTRDSLNDTYFNNAINNQVLFAENLVNQSNSLTVSELADTLGESLHLSQKTKQILGRSVIPEDILEAADLGLRNGAEYFKLLGAGGSGFILFKISPEKQNHFRKLFKERVLDFNFINSAVQVEAF